ncbi:hypothetical protein RJ641_015467 [Dillenia turbinata]|uniref:Uncharacterized protein n=1 Tax=Dillenia turbinata TaxID=194707 RepID=A0AAN8Z3R0_9MAGN
MKKTGLVAASMAAVSASSALSSSSSSCNSKFQFSQQDSISSKDRENSSSQDKFAPRFDGLRFIETLVTAHR